MILSCPSCSTRYSVAEEALGGGRTVRCAACGHSWRAAGPHPETQPELVAAGLDAEELPRPARRDASQAYRAKVEAKKRRRRLTAAATGWGAAAACLLVMLGAAWIFRLDVVRALPQTASAYALAGAEANVYGLRIENLVSERIFDDGEPALSVRAELRNIDRRDRYTPLARFDLRDSAGQPFFAWTVTPAKPVLAPGETAMVAAVLIDPPERANDVVMTLTDTPIAPGAMSAPAPAPEPEPVSLSGHDPAGEPVHETAPEEDFELFPIDLSGLEDEDHGPGDGGPDLRDDHH